MILLSCRTIIGLKTFIIHLYKKVGGDRYKLIDVIRHLFPLNKVWSLSFVNEKNSYYESRTPNESILLKIKINHTSLYFELKMFYILKKKTRKGLRRAMIST